MGKIVSQTEIMSDGNVFHELCGSKPYHIPYISPDKVQGCDLQEGQWGTVGSVISWNYVHDGKAKVTTQLIDEIDEKNKTVIFRVIEGDLFELYKNFVLTLHVDTKGANNLVTWTMEYEKRSEDIDDPNTLMDFFVSLTKDIETHHLKVMS